MGEDGVCPGANDEAFEAGLVQGNNCIALTIEDGGPNDLDGLSNGRILYRAAIANGATAEPLISAVNNALASTQFAAGDGERAVLDFSLSSDSTDAVLESLELALSGSLDKTSISAVKVYIDTNNNGVFEADERVGYGQYAADINTLVLTLEQAYQLPVGETRIIITHTF